MTQEQHLGQTRGRRPAHQGNAVVRHERQLHQRQAAQIQAGVENTVLRTQSVCAMQGVNMMNAT